MTIGLWFTQIWLESQLCVTTFPPKEMSLQLPSRSVGETSPHGAVGHVNIMKRDTWAQAHPARTGFLLPCLEQGKGQAAQGTPRSSRAGHEGTC